MAAPEEIVQELANANEEALTADGFEEELVGICYQAGRPSVGCYDYDRCIKKLMDRDGMDHDTAMEFFEFNVIGSFMGPNTPVFVKLFT